MKTRTIVLSYPHEQPNTPDGKPYLYRVERVTDSTEYSPNDYLLKKDVDTLCEAQHWKVTISPRGKPT